MVLLNKKKFFILGLSSTLISSVGMSVIGSVAEVNVKLKDEKITADKVLSETVNVDFNQKLTALETNDTKLNQLLFFFQQLLVDDKASVNVIAQTSDDVHIQALKINEIFNLLDEKINQIIEKKNYLEAHAVSHSDVNDLDDAIKATTSHADDLLAKQKTLSLNVRNELKTKNDDLLIALTTIKHYLDLDYTKGTFDKIFYDESDASIQNQNLKELVNNFIAHAEDLNNVLTNHVSINQIFIENNQNLQALQTKLTILGQTKSTLLQQINLFTNTIQKFNEEIVVLEEKLNNLEKNSSFSDQQKTNFREHVTFLKELTQFFDNQNSQLLKKLITDAREIIEWIDTSPQGQIEDNITKINAQITTSNDKYRSWLKTLKDLSTKIDPLVAETASITKASLQEIVDAQSQADIQKQKIDAFVDDFQLKILNLQQEMTSLNNIFATHDFASIRLNNLEPNPESRPTDILKNKMSDQIRSAIEGLLLDFTNWLEQSDSENFSSLTTLQNGANDFNQKYSAKTSDYWINNAALERQKNDVITAFNHLKTTFAALETNFSNTDEDMKNTLSNLDTSINKNQKDIIPLTNSVIQNSANLFDLSLKKTNNLEPKVYDLENIPLDAAIIDAFLEELKISEQNLALNDVNLQTNLVSVNNEIISKIATLNGILATNIQNLASKTLSEETLIENQKQLLIDLNAFDAHLQTLKTKSEGFQKLLSLMQENKEIDLDLEIININNVIQNLTAFNITLNEYQTLITNMNHELNNINSDIGNEVTEQTKLSQPNLQTVLDNQLSTFISSNQDQLSTINAENAANSNQIINISKDYLNKLNLKQTNLKNILQIITNHLTDFNQNLNQLEINLIPSVATTTPTNDNVISVIDLATDVIATDSKEDSATSIISIQSEVAKLNAALLLLAHHFINIAKQFKRFDLTTSNLNQIEIVDLKAQLLLSQTQFNSHLTDYQTESQKLIQKVSNVNQNQDTDKNDLANLLIKYTAIIQTNNQQLNEISTQINDIWLQTSAAEAQIATQESNNVKIAASLLTTKNDFIKIASSLDDLKIIDIKTTDLITLINNNVTNLFNSYELYKSKINDLANLKVTQLNNNEEIAALRTNYYDHLLAWKDLIESNHNQIIDLQASLQNDLIKKFDTTLSQLEQGTETTQNNFITQVNTINQKLADTKVDLYLLKTELETKITELNATSFDDFATQLKTLGNDFDIQSQNIIATMTKETLDLTELKTTINTQFINLQTIGLTKLQEDLAASKLNLIADTTRINNNIDNNQQQITNLINNFNTKTSTLNSQIKQAEINLLTNDLEEFKTSLATDSSQFQTNLNTFKTNFDYTIKQKEVALDQLNTDLATLNQKITQISQQITSQEAEITNLQTETNDDFVKWRTNDFADIVSNYNIWKTAQNVLINQINQQLVEQNNIFNQLQTSVSDWWTEQVNPVIFSELDRELEKLTQTLGPQITQIYTNAQTNKITLTNLKQDIDAKLLLINENPLITSNPIVNDGEVNLNLKKTDALAWLTQTTGIVSALNDDITDNDVENQANISTLQKILSAFDTKLNNKIDNLNQMSQKLITDLADANVDFKAQFNLLEIDQTNWQNNWPEKSTSLLNDAQKLVISVLAIEDNLLTWKTQFQQQMLKINDEDLPKLTNDINAWKDGIEQKIINFQKQTSEQTHAIQKLEEKIKLKFVEVSSQSNVNHEEMLMIKKNLLNQMQTLQTKLAKKTIEISTFNDDINSQLALIDQNQINLNNLNLIKVETNFKNRVQEVHDRIKQNTNSLQTLKTDIDTKLKTIIQIFQNDEINNIPEDETITSNMLLLSNYLNLQKSTLTSLQTNINQNNENLNNDLQIIKNRHDNLIIELNKINSLIKDNSNLVSTNKQNLRTHQDLAIQIFEKISQEIIALEQKSESLVLSKMNYSQSDLEELKTYLINLNSEKIKLANYLNNQVIEIQRHKAQPLSAPPQQQSIWITFWQEIEDLFQISNDNFTLIDQSYRFFVEKTQNINGNLFTINNPRFANLKTFLWYLKKQLVQTKIEYQIQLLNIDNDFDQLMEVDPTDVLASQAAMVIFKNQVNFRLNKFNTDTQDLFVLINNIKADILEQLTTMTTNLPNEMNLKVAYDEFQNFPKALVTSNNDSLTLVMNTLILDVKNKIMNLHQSFINKKLELLTNFANVIHDYDEQLFQNAFEIIDKLNIFYNQLSLIDINTLQHGNTNFKNINDNLIKFKTQILNAIHNYIVQLRKIPHDLTTILTNNDNNILERLQTELQKTKDFISKAQNLLATTNVKIEEFTNTMEKLNLQQTINNQIEWNLIKTNLQNLNLDVAQAITDRETELNSQLNLMILNTDSNPIQTDLRNNVDGQQTKISDLWRRFNQLKLNFINLNTVRNEKINQLQTDIIVENKSLNNIKMSTKSLHDGFAILEDLLTKNFRVATNSDDLINLRLRLTAWLDKHNDQTQQINKNQIALTVINRDLRNQKSLSITYEQRIHNLRNNLSTLLNQFSPKKTIINQYLTAPGASSSPENVFNIHDQLTAAHQTLDDLNEKMVNLNQIANNFINNDFVNNDKLVTLKTTVNAMQEFYKKL